MNEYPPEIQSESKRAEEAVLNTLGLDRTVKIRGRGFWIPVIAIGVLLLVVILIAVQNSSSQNTVYKTTDALVGDLTVTVTATGTLEPINQVEVGSEISGIVRIIHADFNDAVEAGQVLALLDSDQLEARVRQSEASLEAADAAVREAEATLREAHARAARSQELLKSQYISQEQLEIVSATAARAEAALAIAKAQLKVRRAALDSDQTTLRKTAIRAPISGIVISRNIEAGQTVAASFQTPVLFTLAEDLTGMELHLFVDEADIGQVREGQEATFSVDAFPQNRFPAVITSLRVAPHTFQGVVTYEALLSVENPDRLLRPGMTATAEIITHRRHKVLLAPNAALRIVPPGKETIEASASGASPTMRQRHVWMTDDRDLIRIAVSTGVSDGRWTEITGGALEAGTPLLVDIVGQDE